MGPLAIFDKSFLQSLNQNEAALFDVLFRTNITPVFYMETLADLSKTNARRTPEEEVAIIAAKTPTWGSCLNASHITMCAGELMGNRVEMSQIPAISGGRPVEVEGKKGVYFKPSREERAFARWQDGKFQDVERLMAKEWREVLGKQPKMRSIKGGLRFSDLSEIRAFSQRILSAPENKWIAFNIGIQNAGFARRRMWECIKYWCAEGLPSMASYAPYINHIAQVDLFFSTAVLTGHISGERASNKIDASYLYYLPFTQIFVSSDNLHARMSPHFLVKNQKFIWGPDLKEDLKRLVDVFRYHPEINELGLIKVASSPPKDDDGLITQLYDVFTPSWRKKWEEVPPEVINNDPKLHRSVMHQVKAMSAAAARPHQGVLEGDWSRENMDMLTIERRVPRVRGDWQFLPANLKE